MNSVAHHYEPSADHLPQNLEAEQGLLGAILCNNDAFNTACAELEPEHFAEPLHARLYEAARAEILDGKRVSPVTLHHRFAADEAMKAIGGTVYMARLAASAVTILNAPSYAAAIRECWLRRQIIMHAQDAIARASGALGATPDDTGTSIATGLASAVLEMTTATQGSGRKAQTAAHIADTIIADLNDAYRTGAEPAAVIPTGYTDLQRTLGGFRRASMVIIAARPSMGKTTFATSTLRRIAGSQKHGVAFFSLEMAARNIEEMMLTDLAYSASNRLEYRDIQPSEAQHPDFAKRLEQLMEVRPLLEHMPLIIDDRGGLTLSQIRIAAMQYKQRFEAQFGCPLSVIAVDHMGKVKPSQRYYGDSTAEMTEVARGLKDIAKELDVCVLALCQLNRGVEGREDKRPMLSDLRQAGTIEEEGDVIGFVYREAYYLERRKYDDISLEDQRMARLDKKRNCMEVLISKNRFGPCQPVEFFCDMGAGRVQDMEHWDRYR
ncbi:replicative DNA helicase [Aestuariivirga sp.]|uniref:replicative DNA helicase n=1 Tax=Aestuariivirga sp. TaxID=2650926 RepID=UPI0039E23B20